MKKVRDALVEVAIIVLVGGLIGAVLAVVSNLFVIGVQWFGQQREASDILSLPIGGDTVSFSSLVFLWAAAAVVVFLKTSLGISRWAGPADSMYAAHQVNEPLDIKTGMASTLAAFASASGGGSVGQYGPIVHFGATMGIWVKRFISSRLSHEIYLGCGVAAAISAGFNAPIAGVVFAHEAILRHFSVRAIAPITVASVSASTLSNYWFPHTATFEIIHQAPSLAEIVPFLVVLTPIFALVAICFMLSLRYTARRAASSSLSPMVLPFVAAVMRDVFEIVPPILKESAYGIGCTTWEVVTKIVLPYTKTGVVGGVMLGLGRALGETMAVTFVIGNAHKLSPSLFGLGNSIASTLANEFAEADSELHVSSLFALGLVLFLITFAVLSAAKFMLMRMEKAQGTKT